jgi:hypothetical protein
MHPAPEKWDRRECEWKHGDGLADASDLRGRHVGLDKQCLLMEASKRISLVGDTERRRQKPCRALAAICA